MADQAPLIPRYQQLVRPNVYRSLYRSDDQSVAKVRVSAAWPPCFPRGCLLFPAMDEISTSLRKSSLESYHPSSSENYLRTYSSDYANNGPSMAQCSLIPDFPAVDNNLSSSDTLTAGGTYNFSADDSTPSDTLEPKSACGYYLESTVLDS
ncbi:hypothetical protein HMPREF1544_00514 [Mucor circinelloides 1006PhL]|uniref:Uncharacterized protein n=1 Tax=Mucor circinelloides f. circinelloides (strain 1006PhL) TaxID=1220926 RepID=S2JQB9_MUCC1|nr:hypothetical protein HMPREF1544_00514 [Mucor circinelloides 1006PhL]